MKTILEITVAIAMIFSPAVASTISTPPLASACAGPVVNLSGTTTSPYQMNAVANGTTINRTSWYSDAVGNGSNRAFNVGNAEPPPLDVCVFGGVVNGHIPLTWGWDQTHTYGGHGDRTVTSRLAVIDGARVHNVEDGWKPRESVVSSGVSGTYPNRGIMLMRNTYMTGIRDDSIENDEFMPGTIEDSLFDGVWTFLSEQWQTGGTNTVGTNEDQYIDVNRVYVRLYTTNGGEVGGGKWFKWQGLTPHHKLKITDSVFAVDKMPRSGWSSLSIPAGTTWMGTNYILWLGTPGGYGGPKPSGVIFLEGQPAKDKWNEVRNNWLSIHGYEPRPIDDWNPMDDPVVAPTSAMPTITPSTTNQTITPMVTILTPSLTAIASIVPSRTPTAVAATPTSVAATPTKTPTPTTVAATPINISTSTAVVVTPTQTSTPAATATPVTSDLIFADGFEVGNFSAWSSNTTDANDLSVNAAAALSGGYGLQALIDDANKIYVSDDRPNAEPRYRARFYFDPNSITMLSGEDFYIFQGYTLASTAVLRVKLIFTSGSYQLKVSLLNDSAAWTHSSSIPIADSSQFIELDWQAATTVGANNGNLALWVNGVQKANLTGVDNDTHRIDRVQLGAVTGIDPGTGGTVFLDGLESRRQTYIGP